MLITMNPKILVCCTVADVKEYCLEHYIKRLKKLTYENKDILLADNSKTEDYMNKINSMGIKCVKTEYKESIPERVIIGMNYLREYFLKNDYDYFLCLQQDVIAPENIIELLLESQKEITTAVVPHLLLQNGKEKEIALLGIDDKNNPGKITYIDYDSTKQYVKGLVKVDFCATTCLLISRKVLEKIKFRYEKRENSTNDLDVNWDDICFCQDAKKEGFQIYANLAAKCEHLFYGGFSVTLGDTRGIKKVIKS